MKNRLISYFRTPKFISFMLIGMGVIFICLQLICLILSMNNTNDIECFLGIVGAIALIGGFWQKKRDKVTIVTKILYTYVLICCLVLLHGCYAILNLKFNEMGFYYLPAFYLIVPLFAAYSLGVLPSVCVSLYLGVMNIIPHIPYDSANHATMVIAHAVILVIVSLVFSLLSYFISRNGGKGKVIVSIVVACVIAVLVQVTLNMVYYEFILKPMGI